MGDDVKIFKSTVKSKLLAQLFLQLFICYFIVIFIAYPAIVKKNIIVISFLIYITLLFINVMLGNLTRKIVLSSEGITITMFPCYMLFGLVKFNSNSKIAWEDIKTLKMKKDLIYPAIKTYYVISTVGKFIGFPLPHIGNGEDLVASIENKIGKKFEEIEYFESFHHCPETCAINKETIEKLKDKIPSEKLDSIKSFINRHFSKDVLINNLGKLNFDSKEVEIILKQLEYVYTPYRFYKTIVHIYPIFVILGLIICFMSAYFNHSLCNNMVNYIVVIIAVCFWMPLFWLVPYLYILKKIIVTSEGIENKRIWFRIKIEWEDIKELKIKKSLIFRTYLDYYIIPRSGKSIHFSPLLIENSKLLIDSIENKSGKKFEKV